jgi:hypothetical protein
MGLVMQREKRKDLTQKMLENGAFDKDFWHAFFIRRGFQKARVSCERPETIYVGRVYPIEVQVDHCGHYLWDDYKANVHPMLKRYFRLWKRQSAWLTQVRVFFWAGSMDYITMAPDEGGFQEFLDLLDALMKPSLLPLYLEGIYGPLIKAFLASGVDITPAKHVMR